MDAAEIEETLFAAGDAKLHGAMCKQLSASVAKIMEIFPVLEAAKPGSKSGIQALCSLHVALDKAKILLQHCSEYSKLYLAVTGESILMKFEKARSALVESLKLIVDIVPQATGCKIVEMIRELEGIVFSLDQSEKQVGEELISLLQKEKRINCNSNDFVELEVFRRAASELRITSSRAALVERRALKKLVDRARVEEDKRKESIVAYLLHLMRRYSKHLRSDAQYDSDSQGSNPCSPTIQASSGEAHGKSHGFNRQLSRLNSFNFKQNSVRSRNMPITPEEFRCPISLQLMYDPVVIASGQTYERVCIEKWFRDGHNTCPKTQQQLPHLSVTPNYCVRGLIGSWCEQNGVPVPDGPPESLDLNYWRLALSEHEASKSRSKEDRGPSQMRSVKVVPLEESGLKEQKANADSGLKKEKKVNEVVASEDCVKGEPDRYESLLAVLKEGQDRGKQREAVQQIRLLLKDDEEARIHMGEKGFVDALVQCLTSAVHEGDEKAQEVGALALFNLAVNNNRNKGRLLAAGVIPLLEDMIRKPGTAEAAAALYLTLSCLDEAKPIIGSSQAVPFLVQLLRASDSQSSSYCRHDALYALYYLSAHPPNIPHLLSAGIIRYLRFLLTAPATAGQAWAEKALAVFVNLASNTTGRKEMVSTPGLVSAVAAALDAGDPAEQEQAASCLLILCTGDEKCCRMVLQEGVIPALVSVSASGTPRGKEKAQKLLTAFREQRQRELSPVKAQLHEACQAVAWTAGSEPVGEPADEPKPLPKSRSRRLGRALTSMWRPRNLSRNEH